MCYSWRGFEDISLKTDRVCYAEVSDSYLRTKYYRDDGAAYMKIEGKSETPKKNDRGYKEWTGIDRTTNAVAWIIAE